MTTPIPIAVIAGQLVVGGAERQLYLWLANLDQRKYKPVVLTLNPGHGDYWEKPVESLGIPLLRVPKNDNRLLRLFEIVKLLRPYKPELLHGWHFFASAYAGLAARLLGVPCVGGIRSSFQPDRQDLEIFLVHHFCDVVVANSNTAAQAYRLSLGKLSQQVHTVPNAIQESFTHRENVREHLSAQYGLEGGDLWICSIGRMEPTKRFDVLLELAALLKPTHKNFQFILIGEGSEKARLEAISADYGVTDCVRFLGEVPNASEWMKGMDIFCFPSMNEGLPNVVMEAAAAGLPVVAWAMPFIEELLPDRSMARLSPPGDVDSMLERLVELLDSKPLREGLGAAAKKQILENFSLARFIDGMSSVYDSTLELGR